MSEEKKPARTKGLSRKRAAEAICWECLGGKTRENCQSPWCPLYAFRSGVEQSDCKLWWMEPKSEWEKLYRKKSKEDEGE